MFENDIKGSVAGASADESLDGKAFTAGLRADWTAYEGAFTVAPHAGLRYTFLEMDDYRDLEIGDMNVVEMPFGVKVSGAFEPAAGWTLQPSVDFTVVPQLGDKDVDTVLGSVDVIDNLYNTELGVELQVRFRQGRPQEPVAQPERPLHVLIDPPAWSLPAPADDQI